MGWDKSTFGGLMETKTYTTIDRSELGWPAGPWDYEPDKMQWTDGETGLPCLAVRNHFFGNWCGYVGVESAHPFYGKGYDIDIDVHGGLTYAGDCDPYGDESTSICHVPGNGEPDHVWWFGFDCLHLHDYAPLDLKMAIERGGVYAIRGDLSYRNLTYVQQECKALAGQLAAHLEGLQGVV